MLLKDIVDNSNYITDEELVDANIVGMTNSAIAEINAKCDTELPLAVSQNISAEPYKALKGTWALRVFEPYLSYSIAANDTDSETRDFHYNRFLQAVNELKDNVEKAVLTIDPTTGEPTGYEGTSGNMAVIDATNYRYPWEGWF
jgi:hypothetical protein